MNEVIGKKTTFTMPVVAMFIAAAIVWGTLIANMEFVKWRMTNLEVAVASLEQALQSNIVVYNQ